MFDFQVEADVKISVSCLKQARNRERAWYG
jgi:hypothetical protein